MKSILIVDDEKSIRKTFQILIEKEGYSVTTAEDAMVALKIMKTKEFDLIITDTIMPKISGLELTKIVREKNPEIPIIIITGEPTIESKRIASGFDSTVYMSKPIKRDELVATINEIIGNV